MPCISLFLQAHKIIKNELLTLHGNTLFLCYTSLVLTLINQIYYYIIFLYFLLFVDESQERLQCKRTCMTCIRLECIYYIYIIIRYMLLHACFWAAGRRPYIVFTFTGSVRNVRNDVNIYYYNICQQHGGRKVGT